MFQFRYCIILCIIILYNGLLEAQILNIDREIIPDSTSKKWELITSLSLSANKQKQSVVETKSDVEVYRNFKSNYTLLLVFKDNAIFNDHATIQNQGMLHVRFRDRDHRKLSPEEFVQYQWNGSWGMQYRYLTGANMRVKWFDLHKNDLYSGIGVFSEWEKWGWSGVKDELVPLFHPEITRQLFRLNTYTKASWQISSVVDIVSSTYLQFPLSGHFFQPRWYFETNLYLTASKHLNFILHWDQIKDTKRVVPINSFSYNYSTGIQLNF